MIPSTKYLLLSLVSCLTTSGVVNGFSSSSMPPRPSIISQSLFSRSDSVVVLFGKNSKKGRLGGLLEEAGGTVAPTAPRSRSSSSSSSSTTKTSKKKKSSKGSDNSSSSSTTIAPGLAEWMTQQDNGGDNETEETVAAAAAAAAAETTKKAKKSDRREQQSIRKEQDEKRTAKIQAAIKTLEEALEENGNLEGILSAVRGLVQLGDDSNTSLKTLLSTKTRSDYRLAWVGGDDAVCHLGTGLHKVPLARLQEVFLSCMGRNRIEVSEVIRILGPFPNVRNILQGSTKVGTAKGSNGGSNGVESMNIVMDSMVDGTGKEILAGTDDNVRRVGLQIYFSDEKAIVAVVPPEDGVRNDPLEDNGAHVLVFVREEDLDDKLDQMRVS
ncbi:unnamed protein product [Cylindrotheca closterium]|uniref:Uncharacterized protein n=1 Tax=Cylindrotheca closterium TaxID=2856 RepID=A0AAD2FHC4_9STRA|nr:unnamed protein product [Cylindrotheca closterium]